MLISCHFKPEVPSSSPATILILIIDAFHILLLFTSACFHDLLLIRTSLPLSSFIFFLFYPTIIALTLNIWLVIAIILTSLPFSPLPAQ
jgi:hypothetical protein